MISGVVYYSPLRVRLSPGLSRGLFPGVENEGIAILGKGKLYREKEVKMDAKIPYSLIRDSHIKPQAKLPEFILENVHYDIDTRKQE
jgi:hypothetical protein